MPRKTRSLKTRLTETPNTYAFVSNWFLLRLNSLQWRWIYQDYKKKIHTLSSLLCCCVIDFWGSTLVRGLNEKSRFGLKTKPAWSPSPGMPRALSPCPSLSPFKGDFSLRQAHDHQTKVWKLSNFYSSWQGWHFINLLVQPSNDYVWQSTLHLGFTVFFVLPSLTGYSHV